VRETYTRVKRAKKYLDTTAWDTIDTRLGHFVYLFLFHPRDAITSSSLVCLCWECIWWALSIFNVAFSCSVFRVSLMFLLLYLMEYLRHTIQLLFLSVWSEIDAITVFIISVEFNMQGYCLISNNCNWKGLKPFDEPTLELD
jgi:hypothetical protein